MKVLTTFNVHKYGITKWTKNMSRVQQNTVQILKNYKVDIKLNDNIQCN